MSEDHWGLVLGHRHDGITLVYRSMFPVAATPGATYWFETGVVFPATFNDSIESMRGVCPSSKSRGTELQPTQQEFYRMVTSTGAAM